MVVLLADLIEDDVEADEDISKFLSDGFLLEDLTEDDVDDADEDILRKFFLCMADATVSVLASLSHWVSTLMVFPTSLNPLLVCFVETRVLYGYVDWMCS